jgi:hypothetical protein
MVDAMSQQLARFPFGTNENSVMMSLSSCCFLWWTCDGMVLNLIGGLVPCLSDQ